MQVPPLEFQSIADRGELLRALIDSLNELRSAVEACSDQEIDFRPPEPADAWTIREHLGHLADNEARLLVRLRAALGERPDRIYSPVLGGARVEQSPEVYGYAGIPVEQSLAALAAIRGFVLASVEALPESVLDSHAIAYPDFPGVGADGRMSVRHILSVMSQHTRHHALYLQRNREAFRGQVAT